MKDFENQKVSIHISYPNGMTLAAMEDSLHVLNDAFKAFNEENDVALSEAGENSPRVTSISYGSFVADIVVPVACALLPILYDEIKRKFHSKGKYAINVYCNSVRIPWTAEDNYKVSAAVIQKYVIGRDALPVKDFVLGLSLSRPYSAKSIRAKVQNTKYLLESQGISNALRIAPLEKCSEMHREEFIKARRDLHI